MSFPPASPSLPPPSRTSHHRTPSNLSTDSPASIPVSLPPQSLPLLPPPQLVPYHLRSVSHSSESTAIESAPRTPADFTKDGFQDSLVISRQVDSPLEYDPDASLAAADISLPDPHPTLSSDPDPESEDTSTVEDHSAQSRLPELSSAFLDSESSARLSRISGLSDGEVGIGLSLLQDFINGVDDSDSRPSSRSSYNSVVVPSRSTTLDNEPTPVDHPTSPSSQQQPPSQSPVPPFVREVTSRSSTHPSVTDSEYGTEEWEGASDIYDNYRYSRLSMASKMSRLSRGSMHTVASAFGLEVPPPVPRDTARSSLDSQDHGRSRMGSLAESSHTNDSSPDAEPPIKVTPERKRSDEGKHVPSPLVFTPEITSSRQTVNDTSATSPLLHATFASPLPSPSAHSTNAFLSPTSASPTFPSAIGGVASALRQRIEMERAISPGGSQRAASPSALSDIHPPSVNRLSTEPIVQDDEDEPRVASPSTSSSPSSRAPSRQSNSLPNELEVSSSSPEASSTTAPSSTDSTFVSEKQALQSSFVVVNPPPPYTPLAVEPETSNVPHASGSVAPSPSPTQRPPPPQSTIRPLNINRAPSSPSARTSLFMPHPHAPKPTLSPTGPMYGRTPPPVSPLSPPLSGPVPGSLMHTLGLLYSHRFDRGHIRRTLYALFETDLSHSIGPVPVTFSLEPPQSVPANHRHPPSNRPPRQPSPLAPPPVQQQSAANITPATSSPSAPSPDPTIPGVNDNQDASGKAIPRANFFPKVQTPRPRSRSFSGYDATTVELELPKRQR